MLAILLKILSILGIILLVFLGILLLAVLLFLFFPVTYRFLGKRNTGGMYAWAKANWLFGLLRIRYAYPEPGNVTVRLLWHTVFDSDEQGKAGEPPAAAGDTHAGSEQQKTAVSDAEKEKQPQTEGPSLAPEPPLPASEQPEPEMSSPEKEQQKSFIMAKYEEIKYTFHGIYDKIKHVRENISYYKALLEEEDTRLLFAHAGKRVGKIVLSVRPRKLKADILFGTGSPDTTGYAYGIYGMLSPRLGNDILVTPDFTQAILEGELYAAGHITVFRLLWNGLLLLLDKKLRIFINKMKAGRNENGR